MWLLAERILSGRPIEIFNSGEMKSDFTCIDDIDSRIIAGLDNPPLDDGKPKAGGSISPHRIYDIGNNRSD